MKKKKRDNIVAILILVIVFIGFKIYFLNQDKEHYLLSEKGHVTVGEIRKRSLPGARTISSITYYYYYYYYYVERIRYEGWGLSDKKFPLGNYFEVTYLPDNPEKSRMEFSQPVPAVSVCTYFENECPFEIGK